VQVLPAPAVRLTLDEQHAVVATIPRLAHRARIHTNTSHAVFLYAVSEVPEPQADQQRLP
jgi:hypothetical protein